MDAKTANKCASLTSEFYKKVADSFSETRQNPWAGWERALSSVDFPKSFSLLDVACGNMRFEKFLAQRQVVPDIALCVDNCQKLISDTAPDTGFDVGFPCEFKNVDLLDTNSNFTDDRFDLIVCFGFFHHIPTTPARVAFLKKLISCLAPFSTLVLSFWQFMKDERIAKKAILTTARATNLFDLALNENDYMLGWKNEADVFRYCHNFTDDEIDELVGEAGGVDVVDSYLEDGKNHDLNRYIVLRKR